METPQPTTPQKTSFWDFWHKKVYINQKEKINDSIFGFIFFSILFWTFYSINEQSPTIQIIFIFSIFFLILTFFKRRNIFYGLLVSYFLNAAIFGIIELLKSCC